MKNVSVINNYSYFGKSIFCIMGITKSTKILRTKLSMLFIFYKSTLAINIPVSVAAGMVISMAMEERSVLVYIHNMLLMQCTVGLLVDLMYKNFARQEEYYFYYNKGLSKLHLWIFVFLFSYFIYCIYDWIL